MILATFFLSQNNPDRSRVPLLATVSGPGGGKSFLIDEWFHPTEADVEALKLEVEAVFELPRFEQFQQSLSLAIRLPVSLNDRMPLLKTGIDGPAYSAETSIAVRALLACV